jgi:hypothetical protein
LRRRLSKAPFSRSKAVFVFPLNSTELGAFGDKADFVWERRLGATRLVRFERLTKFDWELSRLSLSSLISKSTEASALVGHPSVKATYLQRAGFKPLKLLPAKRFPKP